MRFAVLAVAVGLATSVVSLLTDIHEEGRCAIRGHCEKKSFFGGELPCLDNGPAGDLDTSSRQKLVDLCGPAWRHGSVCCTGEQLDALSSNLRLAEGIISSCPACKENFFNLFCTFTCSPDQSLFLNVTQTEKVNGRHLVTELDNLWSASYQRGFYESCKDVKNGASGGKAMDFIGGGAKNYSQFLQFLGDKKILGSPFQINFISEPRNPPRPGEKSMSPPLEKPKSCADRNGDHGCSCIDCPSVCPSLPEIKGRARCHVGHLPCFSMAVILIYSIFLLLFILSFTLYSAFRQHHRQKYEGVRLLHDAMPSDDEDEDGDIVLDPHVPRQYQINYYLGRSFRSLGGICASFPALTLTITVAASLFLSLGWLRFAVEVDPVRLWVSPSSPAAKEKEFFDSNFGPFYRAEQVFIVNDTNSEGPAPVLDYKTLGWWFDVENRVRRMKSLKEGLTLDDVCFKPTDDSCVVQSVSGYFGGSFANVDPDSWKDQLRHCIRSPGSRECLPPFQQPLAPGVVLGGVDNSDDTLNARALIVTWVVNNHPKGSVEEARAMDWEETLKQFLQVAREEAAERGLRLSFSTELSLEQELNKSTNTDARIVAISYVIMLIYASLALGSTTITWRTLISNPSEALVQSKFSLGVVGILIVLMSVSASVGLFSAFGIKVTLIIAEVIPFLVLAVGVDNIFLIVHEFESVNLSHPDESVDDRIARTMGRIGPSILFSAITETISFGLGVFVGMPAVKNFAIYASGAVFINAALQVTMFISVLALNQKRLESRRIDCIPCLTVRKTAGNGRLYNGEGLLQRFIRTFYATNLLDKRVRITVITVFLGIFTAGLALIPTIQLGLDQRVAIPSDSYLISYFNDLYNYLGVGPPVYFVTRDVNITSRKHQQEVCGQFTTCDKFSLSFILEQESKRSEISYISGSAASWIDDFFYWLNPQQNCCKDADGNRCFESRNPPWNISLHGMPEGSEFVEYAEKWLKSSTTASCPLGGKAPYSNSLVLDSEHTMTNASSFRTSHTPLRSQADFIQAYASARRIASDISTRHNIDVFPYSSFYIFFDQYASIVHLSITLLTSALAVIFAVSSFLLGSITTGAIVTLTVLMTLVDITGAMVVANVSLNAVSLVNLIICVGISVEFCAHVARAFMFPSASLLEKAPRKFPDRAARAWAALSNVGGSVVSGITITKLLGVMVLAFTRSKIFEIYYFRVWLALIVFAATHALIFLPVALSFVGSEGYADLYADGGLEEDLAARGYRSLLLDDDDYDFEDEDL